MSDTCRFLIVLPIFLYDIAQKQFTSRLIVQVSWLFHFFEFSSYYLILFMVLQQLILFDLPTSAMQLSIDEYFTQVTFAYYDARFRNREFLGKGSGSEVFKSFDQNFKIEVALKEYNKTQLSESNQIDVVRQIQILRWLSQLHQTKYVVQFYGAFKVKKQRGFIYCIAIELCQCTLSQYLQSSQYAGLTQESRLQTCLYICEGVKFLHQKNFIHRDLKPANILLASRNGKLLPLIGDFGHSKQLEIGLENTNLKGTIKYAHPDWLYEKDYGFQWDIYSLGLIILEVMTGYFLFPITLDLNTEVKFMNKMREVLGNLQYYLDKFGGLNEKIKQLVWSCLKTKDTSADYIVEQIKNILQDLEEDIIEEPIPNFNKNKPAFIDQKSPSDKPKVISKISTIQSDQPKSESKKTEQIYEESESYESIHQSVDQSISKITLSNNDRRSPKQSEIKQAPKRNSEIISLLEDSITESVVKQTKNKPFITLNLLEQSEELGISQSQKRVLQPAINKMTRSQSFSLGTPNQSYYISKETTSQLQLIPKIIKVGENVGKKLIKHEQAMTQLKDLQVFKASFMKLMIIQECQIDIKHKKKILLFGLLHLVGRLRIYIANKKDNEYSAKYFSMYLENLQREVKILRDNYIGQYMLGEKTQSQSIIQAHNPKLQEIEKQFRRSLDRLDMPILGSKLLTIIQY